MKTILITGGAGYIGSHTAKTFLDTGYQVVIFDNLSRGYKQATEILKNYGKVTFVQGDLRNKSDLKNLFDTNQIDAVLHFAAFCYVNESMEKPELYFENNVVGSLNLFAEMVAHKVLRLVFSSTCAVYGETQYLPVDEEHPLKPTNLYGESKLLVEKMLKWFDTCHSLKSIILRYFNVCGAEETGEIGDSKKPSQLLMQNAVRGAMGIEPFYLTCPKVETPDGTPIRDYIDVVDLAKAHLAAFNLLERTGESDIFNIGNGKGYSVLEIVRNVENVLNTKIEQNSCPPRKGEYAKIYAKNEKALNMLKWKPEKSLEDSVCCLKNWYLKHPNGYDY